MKARQQETSVRRKRSGRMAVVSGERLQRWRKTDSKPAGPVAAGLLGDERSHPEKVKWQTAEVENEGERWQVGS
jgi:hypothetical protein